MSVYMYMLALTLSFLQGLTLQDLCLELCGSVNPVVLTLPPSSSGKPCRVNPRKKDRNRAVELGLFFYKLETLYLSCLKVEILFQHMHL